MSFELATRLAARHAQHLYRRRPLLDSPQGPVVIVDGRPLLAFCSNDYLGLANHPEVIAAWRAGAERWGVGGGSSHLVIGHSRPHHELEEALAEFTGRPRALLFSSGYMANLGAVTALVGQGDTVLEDRLNHASLLDAGRLSGARFNRYRHNDASSLERRLQTARGNTLVVTDGVFSMDGDLADLPTLCASAKAKGAWVMVDDAHGFGPLGATGGGIVEHFGLGQDDVQVLVGTLGKAFGTGGAFIAGSEDLIESLIQFARPYIYTTSQPPALACATLASLQVLRREHWRREHLARLIARFRQGARDIGLTLMDSSTPIQPILIGDSARALHLSSLLKDRGLLVSAIRPPTVPAGTARLRVTLSAAHSAAQLELLLQALAECWPLLAPAEADSKAEAKIDSRADANFNANVNVANVGANAHANAGAGANAEEHPDG